MRKAIYRAPEDEARELLARAHAVHIATTREDGAPMSKTVHAVLDDGGLAFHGAPAGEKLEGLGRRAVASASEVVASIPSTFLDPERACPATTYYVSAQAHGILAEVTDPERKARVLAAIMTKYQPEGGYVPIDAEHPLYRKAVRGILVAELRIDRVDGKAKLGQNRTPAERVRVLEQLWRRGAPGDVEAVARIVSRFRDLPPLPFLTAPAGSRLLCHVPDAELDEAVSLLGGESWVAAFSAGELRRSLASSVVRVGARDERGELVAFARAVSDDRTAWVYDVVVREGARSRGLGRAVVGLLLDHPAVRRCRHVRLTTRDAERFYARLGFSRLSERPRHPWTSVEMIASRDQNANVAPAPA
jgi:nitroimidazol reductase NimA-like FMN-containing flavoprotein (pyridoxamine 5'-phosphate oxidase superfamily)/GNAT superfamily N-acetyltransferase